MNPSNTPGTTTGVERKNSTFDRLHKWFDHAGVHYFSFVNTTDKRGEIKPVDIDWDTLKLCLKGHTKIIALGGFASTALGRLNIEHYTLPHPSPRNRKFNDAAYEPMVMEDLRRYVTK
jgi:hypothetical protein